MQNREQDLTFAQAVPLPLLPEVVRLLEKYPGELKLPGVAVGGCLNTGKTTLVNNLLKIDPGFTAGTPCPVSYTYGTQFTAQLWSKDGCSRLLASPRELAYQLKTKSDRDKPVNVAVTINHPFLKLCRLVDLPGYDSPAWFKSTAAEQILAAAEELVYLFHQRGIQLSDRDFLQRLKELRGQNGRQALSFWLNCNAGPPDGTSLASTKTALKELFGAEIPVYYLNARDPKSVAAFGLFLQERLAAGLFAQIEAGLRAQDALLPEMLAGLPALSEETGFLLGFWRIKEKAEEILALKQEIAELRKQKRASAALAENLRNLSRNLSPAPGPLRRQTRPEGFPEAGDRPPFSDAAGLVPRPEPGGEKPADRRGSLDLAGGPANPPKIPPVTPGKPVVGAWGPFSSGKSTFFNALMKETVLPAEDKPTTSYLTRLHYGPEKVAVVGFPKQFTFETGAFRKNYFRPRRQEIDALWQYLTVRESGLPAPAGIEAAIGGKYRPVTRDQLTDLLARTKAFQVSPALPAKTHFLIGGSGGEAAGGAVTAVRLTFPPAARLVYHLERDRPAFHQLLTGPLNCLVETVDVFYPAEIFKLATFLDPPGIDSVFDRHRHLSLQALTASDLLLVFIHGKQLIPASYRKEIRECLAGRAAHLVKSGRVLFLLNFADTLTAPERERAANFVRREFAALVSPAPLFLVSSRSACAGRDGGFEKVLRRIEEILFAREKEAG